MADFEYMRLQIAQARVRKELAHTLKERIRKRYPLNLVLLALLVLGTTVWFRWHASPTIRNLQMITGPIGLIAIYDLLKSQLPIDAIRQKPVAWNRWLLDREHATLILGISLSIIFILFAGTSSLYIEYAPTKNGRDDYVVEFHGKRHFEKDYRNLKTIHVNSNVPPDGFLYLPFMRRPDTFELRVTKPAFEFDPLRLNLAQSQPRRVRIPVEFKPRTNRCLRIVPGRKYLTVPRRSRVADHDATQELVVRDGADKEILSTPFFLEAVYIGGPESLLKLMIEREEASGELERSTVQHLFGINKSEMDDDDKQALNDKLASLARYRRLLSTREFTADENLTISVRSTDHDASEEEFETTVQLIVQKPSGIQTIVVK